MSAHGLIDTAGFFVLSMESCKWTRGWGDKETDRQIQKRQWNSDQKKQF